MKKVFTNIWIAIIGSILLAILIFGAGIAVGRHEGRFGNNWENNYRHMMGGSRSPFALQKNGEGLIPHGAFGEIVAVNLPTIVVKGQAEAEKNILVSSSTAIRAMHTLGSTADLKVGTTIVVIGDPNDEGQISARLIRILPLTMTATSTIQ